MIRADYNAKMELRVASLEPAVKANAGATGKGSANLQAQIDDLRIDVSQIKTELASLRKELPGMIAETMREALAGMRGL
jgi:hypothetical protein